jgi:DNA-binding GntR family transcriptional regulator
MARPVPERHGWEGRLGPDVRKFYSTLYAACDNTYLYKVIFDLGDLSFRSPGLLSSVPGRDQQSIQGLKKIVNALRKSDGRMVEKLMIKQKENAPAAWKTMALASKM